MQMVSIQEQLQGIYSAGEIQSLTYLILEEVCRKDKSVLLREKELKLSPDEQIKIQQMVDDLKKFRPIQYIIGISEFYGLTFCVNENVLIPRPETEELVECILKQFGKLNTPQTILDIGTGSGCIATTLAKYLPESKVYASDISGKALEIARENARSNNVNVEFFQQDILLPNPVFPTKSFSLIVSNPPYIVPSEKQAMSPNVVDYEPSNALFVPEDKPLLFYERIAEIGQHYLEPDGCLFFETNTRFGKDVAEMLQKKDYTAIKIIQDISGNNRIVKAIYTKNQ